MRNRKFILAVALLAIGVSVPAFAQNLTVVVGTAPPAPIVEPMPVAPGPQSDFVWHAGHWRWIDEQYVWLPGHWVRRPHPQAVWIEPLWVHDAHGYHFQEGHWNDHPVPMHQEHHDDHHHDDHH